MTPYQPIFELTRGNIVESIHYGAYAIVDSQGNLLSSLGDPHHTTYLRSTAKPFQALPFIERGGHEHYALTPKEIAILCASHSGTDEHVETLLALQAKIGISEADLLCGVHYPFHEPTADALKKRGESPTPQRHNCSGKHTGMLAHALLRHLPTPTYLQNEHPVQESILHAFAEMCSVNPGQVEVGTDGCSAPNFAIPLYNAALGYARLVDPNLLAPQRAAACRTITHAMTTHPQMVAGPGRFDTRLMQATGGRILSKMGAEGYQGMAILPGALAPHSPGMGIVIKISDGDSTARARHGVSLALLQFLGALTPEESQALADLGPETELRNFRNLFIGFSRPAFRPTPTP